MVSGPKPVMIINLGEVASVRVTLKKLVRGHDLLPISVSIRAENLLTIERLRRRYTAFRNSSKRCANRS